MLIEDDGSIVIFDGSLAPWFVELLSKIEPYQVLFTIGSNFRLRRDQVWRNQRIYSVEVPELSPTERSGLLKRYSDLEDIALTLDDFRWLVGLLQGYPDQVFFAVDMVQSSGIAFTKDHSNDIIEFNKNRASIVLRHYVDDSDALDLLRLLAGFEFISYKLIEEIYGSSQILKAVRRFVLEAICEEMGASREYVRVNDVVRDYILRNQLQISSAFKTKISAYAHAYVANATPDEDASAYYFFLKEALIEGIAVRESLLIPAHFLNTLKELYADRRLNEVVVVADRILEKSLQLDRRVEQDVRYYLCLALARQKQERFLAEVQKIEGAEYDFLLGFYYRRQGRYKDAEARLKKALAAKRSERRARRELVTTYLLMDEWEKADSLAKDNYYQFPTNPFLVQAYFNCLIQRPQNDVNRKELEGLLSRFEEINSEKSKEMLASAKAFFYAIYEHNEHKALEVIDDAIATYSGNDYPSLTKMDICVRFTNVAELGKTLEALKARDDRRSTLFNSYKKSEAMFYLFRGERDRAVRIVEREMLNYSEVAKARLLERLNQP